MLFLTLVTFLLCVQPFVQAQDEYSFECGEPVSTVNRHPFIARLRPPHFSAAGGMPVTVIGGGFTQTTTTPSLTVEALRFNGRPCKGRVTVLSDSALLCSQIPDAGPPCGHTLGRAATCIDWLLRHVSVNISISFSTDEGEMSEVSRTVTGGYSAVHTIIASPLAPGYHHLISGRDVFAMRASPPFSAENHQWVACWGARGQVSEAFTSCFGVHHRQSRPDDKLTFNLSVPALSPGWYDVWLALAVAGDAFNELASLPTRSFGSSTFQIHAAITDVVPRKWHARMPPSALLTVVGVGFGNHTAPRGMRSVSIRVGNAPCTVTAANATALICAFTSNASVQNAERLRGFCQHGVAITVFSAVSSEEIRLRGSQHSTPALRAGHLLMPERPFWGRTLADGVGVSDIFQTHDIVTRFRAAIAPSLASGDTGGRFMQFACVAGPGTAMELRARHADGTATPLCMDAVSVGGNVVPLNSSSKAAPQSTSRIFEVTELRRTGMAIHIELYIESRLEAAWFDVLLATDRRAMLESFYRVTDHPRKTSFLRWPAGQRMGSSFQSPRQGAQLKLNFNLTLVHGNGELYTLHFRRTLQRCEAEALTEELLEAAEESGTSTAPLRMRVLRAFPIVWGSERESCAVLMEVSTSPTSSLTVYFNGEAAERVFADSDPPLEGHWTLPLSFTHVPSNEIVASRCVSVAVNNIDAIQVGASTPISVAAAEGPFIQPQVVAVSPKNVSEGTQITIRGDAFVEERASIFLLALMVDEMEMECESVRCDVHFCSCTIPPTIEAGLYSVRVVFAHAGEALQSHAPADILRVDPVFSQLVPIISGASGGVVVSVLGKAFPAAAYAKQPSTVQIVMADNYACHILSIAPTRITCATPDISLEELSIASLLPNPDITDEGIVGVVIAFVVHMERHVVSEWGNPGGVELLYDFRAGTASQPSMGFYFSFLQLPTIEHVSPSTQSALLPFTLTITGLNLRQRSFSVCRADDGTTSVDSRPDSVWSMQWCKVCMQVLSETSMVICNAGHLPTGTFFVSASTPHLGNSRLNATLHSQLSVESVTPSRTSSFGGGILTVHGAGFAKNAMLVWVGDEVCHLLQVSETKATCQLPHFDIPRSGAHAVSVGRSAAPPGSEDSFTVRCTNGPQNHTQLLLCLVIFDDSLLPQIHSIAPTFGQLARVTVFGAGFTSGAAVVSFGATSCEIHEVHLDRIICWLRGIAAAGTFGMTYFEHPMGFAMAQAPESHLHFRFGLEVASIWPAEGSIAGGQTVTVLGTGFTTTSSVMLGDQPCTVVSSTLTSIVCKTTARPELATFVTSVAVHANNDNLDVHTCCQYTFSLQMTPIISSLTPESGVQGTRATILGQRFRFTLEDDQQEHVSVHLGGVPTTDPTILSDGTINLLIPRLPASLSAPVVRFLHRGLAWSRGIERFMFRHGVARVSPNEAGYFGGQLITLIGDGFTGPNGTATTVTVCGWDCPVSLLDFTIIVCTLPRMLNSQVRALLQGTPRSHWFQWEPHIRTHVRGGWRESWQHLDRNGDGVDFRMGELQVLMSAPPHGTFDFHQIDVTLSLIRRELHNSEHVNTTWPMDCYLRVPHTRFPDSMTVTQLGARTFWETGAARQEVLGTVEWWSSGRLQIFMEHLDVLSNHLLLECRFVQAKRADLGLHVASIRVGGVPSTLEPTVGVCPVDVTVHTPLSSSPMTICGTNPSACPQLTLRTALSPTVTSFSPLIGATSGRARVDIFGQQFGLRPENVEVILDGQTCGIITLTETQINCETSPRVQNHTVRIDEKTMTRISVLQRGTSGVLTTRSFSAAERWSSLAAWSGEVAPQRNAIVVIPRGVTVLLDTQPPPLLALLIRGKLVIADDQKLDLLVTYIVIDDGAMVIGSSNEPRSHPLTITFVGDRLTPTLRGNSNAVALAKGITMWGGMLTVDSVIPSHQHVKLHDSALQGESQLTIREDVSWPVGARIVVGTVGPNFGNVEVRHVTARRRQGSFTYLSLDIPLSFDHAVHREQRGTLHYDLSADVALLSRTVTFRSDPQNDDFFGCTLEAVGGLNGPSIIELSGVHFLKCGKRGTDEREAVLVRDQGSASRSYLRFSSFEWSHTTAFRVHNTRGFAFRSNVVALTAGHGVAATGSVANCELTSNIVIGCSNPAGDLLASAAFVLTHPGVILRNNLATGALKAGFWYNLRSQVAERCSDQVPLNRFLANSAHSVGHGLLIEPAHFANARGDCFASDPETNPLQRSMIEEFFVHDTFEAAMHLPPGSGYTIRGLIALHCGAACVAFHGVSSLVSDIDESFIVGTLKTRQLVAVAPAVNTNSTGILLPLGDFEIRNTAFRGFNDAGSAALDLCAERWINGVRVVRAECNATSGHHLVTLTAVSTQSVSAFLRAGTAVAVYDTDSSLDSAGAALAPTYVVGAGYLRNLLFCANDTGSARAGAFIIATRGLTPPIRCASQGVFRISHVSVTRNTVPRMKAAFHTSVHSIPIFETITHHIADRHRPWKSGHHLFLPEGNSAAAPIPEWRYGDVLIELTPQSFLGDGNQGPAIGMIDEPIISIATQAQRARPLVVRLSFRRQAKGTGPSLGALINHKASLVTAVVESAAMGETLVAHTPPSLALAQGLKAHSRNGDAERVQVVARSALRSPSNNSDLDADTLDIVLPRAPNHIGVAFELSFCHGGDDDGGQRCAPPHAAMPLVAADHALANLLSDSEIDDGAAVDHESRKGIEMDVALPDINGDVVIARDAHVVLRHNFSAVLLVVEGELTIQSDGPGAILVSVDAIIVYGSMLVQASYGSNSSANETGASVVFSVGDGCEKMHPPRHFLVSRVNQAIACGDVSIVGTASLDGLDGPRKRRHIARFATTATRGDISFNIRTHDSAEGMDEFDSGAIAAANLAHSVYLTVPTPNAPRFGERRQLLMKLDEEGKSNFTATYFVDEPMEFDHPVETFADSHGEEITAPAHVALLHRGITFHCRSRAPGSGCHLLAGGGPSHIAGPAAPPSHVTMRLASVKFEGFGTPARAAITFASSCSRCTLDDVLLDQSGGVGLQIGARHAVINDVVVIETAGPALEIVSTAENVSITDSLFSGINLATTHLCALHTGAGEELTHFRNNVIAGARGVGLCYVPMCTLESKGNVVYGTTTAVLARAPGVSRIRACIQGFHVYRNSLTGIALDSHHPFEAVTISNVIVHDSPIGLHLHAALGVTLVQDSLLGGVTDAWKAAACALVARRSLPRLSPNARTPTNTEYCWIEQDVGVVDECSALLPPQVTFASMLLSSLALSAPESAASNGTDIGRFDMHSVTFFALGSLPDCAFRSMGITTDARATRVLPPLRSRSINFAHASFQRGAAPAATFFLPAIATALPGNLTCGGGIPAGSPRAVSCDALRQFRILDEDGSLAQSNITGVLTPPNGWLTMFGCEAVAEQGQSSFVRCAVTRFGKLLVSSDDTASAPMGYAEIVVDSLGMQSMQRSGQPPRLCNHTTNEGSPSCTKEHGPWLPVVEMSLPLRYDYRVTLGAIPRRSLWSLTQCATLPSDAPTTGLVVLSVALAEDLDVTVWVDGELRRGLLTPPSVATGPPHGSFYHDALHRQLTFVVACGRAPLAVHQLVDGSVDFVVALPAAQFIVSYARVLRGQIRQQFCLVSDEQVVVERVDPMETFRKHSRVRVRFIAADSVDYNSSAEALRINKIIHFLQATPPDVLQEKIAVPIISVLSPRYAEVGYLIPDTVVADSSIFRAFLVLIVFGGAGVLTFLLYSYIKGQHWRRQHKVAQSHDLFFINGDMSLPPSKPLAVVAETAAETNWAAGESAFLDTWSVPLLPHHDAAHVRVAADFSDVARRIREKIAADDQNRLPQGPRALQPLTSDSPSHHVATTPSPEASPFAKGVGPHLEKANSDGCKGGESDMQGGDERMMVYSHLGWRRGAEEHMPVVVPMVHCRTRNNDDGSAGTVLSESVSTFPESTTITSLTVASDAAAASLRHHQHHLSPPISPIDAGQDMAKSLGADDPGLLLDDSAPSEAGLLTEASTAVELHHRRTKSSKRSRLRQRRPKPSVTTPPQQQDATLLAGAV